MFQKTITYFSIVIIVIGFIFLANGLILATPPTQDPPGGNVPAPLNVGSTDQTKSGTLTMGDVFSAGGKNLVIGDDTFLTDIDVANMLGIYGNQNSDRAGIRLGSDGAYIWGDDGDISTGGNLSVGGSTYSSGNYDINNTGPMVYFRDTDHRSAMVHVNSNIFYILRGSGVNSAGWEAYGGYWPLTINLENNNATFGGNLSVPRGNVGIGTTEPAQKLHVAGNLQVDGYFNYQQRDCYNMGYSAWHWVMCNSGYYVAGIYGSGGNSDAVTSVKCCR